MLGSWRSNQVVLQLGLSVRAHGCGTQQHDPACGLCLRADVYKLILTFACMHNSYGES